MLVFFGVTAVFVLVAGQYPEGEEEVAVKNSVLKNTTVTFKNVVVNADVADTALLREKGLSGRTSLPERRGMWFVYQKDGVYSYWMPDMNFPIDIIWFDENLQVVYMEENATPESYPHIFTPNAPARYVLEVPAGFAQQNEVSFGDRVMVSSP